MSNVRSKATKLLSKPKDDCVAQIFGQKEVNPWIVSRVKEGHPRIEVNEDRLVNLKFRPKSIQHVDERTWNNQDKVTSNDESYENGCSL